MKQASLYAQRIRKFYNSVRRQVRAVPTDDGLTDPVEQILLSVLSRGTTQNRARQGLNRIKRSVVDFNELRVTPPGEILEMLGRNFPGAREKATAIRKLLNAIFEREHSLDLTRLRDQPKRAAREYLEGLEGIDPYTVASVMLLSLGGHAIPVDDNMMRLFREHELIDEQADVAQVQSFLERHIPASEARTFALVMQEYAASAASKARRSASRRVGDSGSKRRRGAGKAQPRTARRKSASKL